MVGSPERTASLSTTSSKSAFLHVTPDVTLSIFLQLTIVLASGETVTASPTSHPDLFWGCKGAGCNFGVVTEFVLQAHPQRSHVFLTRLVFPVEKLETVVNSVEKWFETSQPDERVTWGCFRPPPEYNVSGPYKIRTRKLMDLIHLAKPHHHIFLQRGC